MLLALALAGALGIFFYSAAQTLKADEHSATRSFNPDPVAPGGSVVVTIDTNDIGGFGSVTETLPAGFTYVSSSLGTDDVDASGGQVIVFTLIGEPDFTYTVTAPMEAGDYPFSGTVVDSDRNSLAVTGDTSLSVAAPQPEPTPEPDPDRELGASLSSYKADTAVSVTINSMAGAGNPISGGRDIVVTLSGFQIPAEIEEDTVIIDGLMDDEFYGHPASIAVSGSTITLSLPTRNAATGERVPDIEGDYEIIFKQSAGLKTPNSAGSKTITVADRDAAAHEMMVGIVSHISVKPGWVSRGTDITVTAKGVNAAGDTTAHLYLGTVAAGDLENLDLVESDESLVLGRASNDGGTVIIDGISTTRSDFEADAMDATVDANASGTNLIVMVDAAGTVVGHTYLGLLPSVSLDVSDVRRTGEVEVSVSDWYYGDDINLVRINGITVDLPDDTNRPHDGDDEPDEWIDTRHDPVRVHEVSIGSDGKETFTVIVDRNTRLGEMQVDLRGSSMVKQGSYNTADIHKQTVQVGFFPLTITPSNADGDGQAVTEQVIQIEGEEFLARACITSIMVGERDIDEATNGDTISSDRRDCVDTDSNGKLTGTFKVPRGLKPGTYSVVVRDDGNRVGEANLVIPKPEITLDPMTSQRGSTVTVVGKNFPADDVVTIDYRGITVEAAQTDTVGNFRANFKVPITAPIGADHEVLVASENKADGLPDAPQNQPEVVLTAAADHHVSDEYLRFNRQQVSPGEHLGIISGNLPLFTPVSLSIGGRNVAGKVLGEDNASDGSGEYVDSVLVPQLPAGITIVELIVHTERGEDVRVAEFVEITDIVTRPTAEVFADLIAAGQLTSVWRYRIDETGSDWDSYDPQYADQPGINDLQLVSTNDIVWIRVTENVTFQGAPLFAGWNLRTLE